MNIALQKQIKKNKWNFYDRHSNFINRSDFNANNKLGIFKMKLKEKIKQLDKLSEETKPNIYKFLVDRGIDDEIAGDVQEMVSLAWYSYVSEARETTEGIFDDLEEKMDETLEKFKESFLDIDNIWK